MKIKPSKASGRILNWMVAICEGYVLKTGINSWYGDTPCMEKYDEKGITRRQLWELAYSYDWHRGGTVIEREKIGVWWDGRWHAKYDGCSPNQVQDANDPLIAAMRCYVISKMDNDEIDVPEEIINI